MSLFPTERRRAPRHRLSSIILLNGSARARLITVSSIGVFFETDLTLSVGQEISLVLPFPHATPAEIHASCTGRVLRVEKAGNQYRVAASYDLVGIASAPPG